MRGWYERPRKCCHANRHMITAVINMYIILLLLIIIIIVPIPLRYKSSSRFFTHCIDLSIHKQTLLMIEYIKWMMMMCYNSDEIFQ